MATTEDSISALDTHILVRLLSIYLDRSGPSNSWRRQIFAVQKTTR
jgi:hypothetical protein